MSSKETDNQGTTVVNGNGREAEEENTRPYVEGLEAGTLTASEALSQAFEEGDSNFCLNLLLLLKGNI